MVNSSKGIRERGGGREQEWGVRQERHPEREWEEEGYVFAWVGCFCCCFCFLLLCGPTSQCLQNCVMVLIVLCISIQIVRHFQISMCSFEPAHLHNKFEYFLDCWWVQEYCCESSAPMVQGVKEVTAVMFAYRVCNEVVVYRLMCIITCWTNRGVSGF